MSKEKEIIVYTINFNNYDEPKPVYPDFNVKYLAITDNPEEYKDLGWDILPQPKLRGITNPRKLSRYLKINSHKLPKHKYSLYIDASLRLEFPPSFFISMLGDNDIAICRHVFDDCVYEHQKKCERLQLDDPVVMEKQISYYRKQGLPEHEGLTENCFIIRKNTPQIKKLNSLWWSEYKKGSQRDQLSLPYARWKTKTPITYLPFNVRDTYFCSGWGEHLKSRIWK